MQNTPTFFGGAFRINAQHTQKYKKNVNIKNFKQKYFNSFPPIRWMGSAAAHSVFDE